MILLVIIFILTIAIFTLPYLLFSIGELPQGSGTWQIGTTNITWDTPDRSRTGIIAKIWYPTDDRSNSNSPYIGKLGRAFTDSIVLNIIYKLIFRLLRHVSSPALINAVPSQIFDNFPVVLFSPCWTGINYMGTFYAFRICQSWICGSWYQSS